MSFCWNEINSGIKSLILILCIFSLMTLSLWDDVATKFLHAAGIISALYFLATRSKDFILLSVTSMDFAPSP